MQFVKKLHTKVNMLLTSGILAIFSLPSFAVEDKDLLSDALHGSIQKTLGSDATFWKLFILVDVILGAAAYVSTKNPLVFLGVIAIAFIPGVLLKLFVF